MTERQKQSVSDGKQQVLIPSSEREFINVSYIYETNRHTRVHRAWRRRQTPRHVYLIRFQNGSFHMWCPRTLDKVSPNRDTVTGNEACLSKGFARFKSPGIFTRTAFSLHFVIYTSVCMQFYWLQCFISAVSFLISTFHWKAASCSWQKRVWCPRELERHAALLSNNKERPSGFSQYFTTIAHSLTSVGSTCVAALNWPCTSANVLAQMPQRSSENRH